MLNLFKHKKFYHLFLAIGIILTVVFVVFQVNRMSLLYESAMLEMRSSTEKIAAKVESGDHNFTNETLALIIRSYADRTLEDSMVGWFKKYLLISIFSLGAVGLVGLFEGFIKPK